MIGNVKVENIDKDKKITTVTGNIGTINDIKKTAEIEGSAKLENAELICTADRIIYNQLTNKVNTFGKTLVNYKSK
jgi:lipopolysaccharide export system protein LptA